ncbi:MAG: cytochrome c biogenesis protein [Eggerthellaceae bacterium]|jgi:heme exporter protein C|nr:cytochrome c biogenesis protein [Eggerthellaceae bacterium]MCH4220999.1 cytochrome c biogenesis protein [Eggerthellaceae bacterium]
MTQQMKRARESAGARCDRYAPLILGIGAILSTLGFILAFTLAAPVNGAAVDGTELIGDQMVSNQLLFSQKIFYFHMPVAITSFVAIGVAAFYGIRFLMTHRACYDMRGRVASEIALVFVIMVMCSGEMWERFEWGVWWTWEPRLTTYFILMLLVFGYFILRAAVDDPERRATYASVFSIVTFVDVPICFMITRLVPSGVHPTIFRSDSGLSPDMLIPLLLAMFGMFCIAFGVYRLRLRCAQLDVRLEALKERLDD